VSLRRPFEQPVDSAKLRRRVLVFAGMWFLLAGMLAALGLIAVLLVSFGLALIGGALVGGAWLLRRYPVRLWLQSAFGSIKRAFRDEQARLGKLGLRQRLRRFATRFSPMVGQLRARASETFRTAPVAIDRQSQTLRLNQHGAELRREGKYEGAAEEDQRARLGKLGLRQRLRFFATRYSPMVGQLRARASETFRTAPVAIDRQSQALRLNEHGAELRREGKYEGAAEEHRAALVIVRELGDRQAEALTLNNLALALVHTGSVAIAVQHFEQALDLLRELGEEEHEGRVIANLAVVRRRQGRDEDADSLLHAALDKLPPESSAYRQVEEQLRRAS
jgi:tetratricopeptide (TPR) repeat protein